MCLSQRYLFNFSKHTFRQTFPAFCKSQTASLKQFLYFYRKLVEYAWVFLSVVTVKMCVTIFIPPLSFWFFTAQRGNQRSKKQKPIFEESLSGCVGGWGMFDRGMGLGWLQSKQECKGSDVNILKTNISMCYFLCKSLLCVASRRSRRDGEVVSRSVRLKAFDFKWAVKDDICLWGAQIGMTYSSGKDLELETKAEDRNEILGVERNWMAFHNLQNLKKILKNILFSF